MYAPPEISGSIDRVTKEVFCTYNPWLLIVIFNRVYLQNVNRSVTLSTFPVSLFSFDDLSAIKLSYLAFVDGVAFHGFEI